MTPEQYIMTPEQYTNIAEIIAQEIFNIGNDLLDIDKSNWNDYKYQDAYINDAKRIIAALNKNNLAITKQNAVNTNNRIRATLLACELYLSQKEPTATSLLDSIRTALTQSEW